MSAMSINGVTHNCASSMTIAPIQPQVASAGTAGTSLFATPAPVLNSMTQFTGLQGGIGSPVSSLQQLQGSLQQGVIPSLDTLQGLTAGLDPAGPDTLQINARVGALLTQAGPVGTERARQYGLSQGIRALDNVAGALTRIAGNLDPGGPEAQQLQARLVAINATKAGLQQQLDTSLANDPSRGGAIGVNGQQVVTTTPPQPPPTQQPNILVLMMQLMLQMMQLLLARR